MRYFHSDDDGPKPSDLHVWKTCYDELRAGGFIARVVKPVAQGFSHEARYCQPGTNYPTVCVHRLTKSNAEPLTAWEELELMEQAVEFHLLQSDEVK